MHEKLNSIEELAELREWMKGVPEQLAVQEVGHGLLMDRGHQGERGGIVNAMCGVSEANLQFFCLDVFTCNSTNSWVCIFAILKIFIFKYMYHKFNYLCKTK